MPNEISKAQCLRCGRIYKEPPIVTYADGHGGRLLEMCGCGSDLFVKVAEAAGGDDEDT